LINVSLSDPKWEGFGYVLIARSFIRYWFCNGGFGTNLGLEILAVLLNLETRELFLAY
jgi:hypothetical protein